MSWTDNADEKLQMFLQNMVAEGQMAQRVGHPATPAQVVGASWEMVLDVIRTSLPLAHIMDTSDLILHAEGPSVRDSAPHLAAANWLTRTAESAIRKLSGSLFHIENRDVRRLKRALDLRLTGFAQGSLYAGIAVQAPPSGLLSVEDEPVIQSVREALRQLPDVPRLIGDEKISDEIRELIPDPARRDSTFEALFRLAPTGRIGIHTLDIASPGKRSSELSQRERVVLKDAIDNPRMANRKTGSFAGELREIDLDANRFHLRNVAGIGGLRCVLTGIGRDEAKKVIGEFVRVQGEYETDREDRPRLMMVRKFEVLPRAEQPTLM